MKQFSNGYINNRVLKLNVGFVLADGPGHSHETTVNVPAVRVSEDVDLAYVRGILRLSRTKEGILVQGELALGIEDECYRCVRSLARELIVDLEELYSTPGSSRVTEFMVDDDAILDLSPLLREEAIIADARGALCTADCKGLCPTCGANLNDGACECDAAIDPRFASLRGLLDQQNET